MKIFLKKNEDRRLNIGHQWIFSNEIEKTEGDLSNGDVVELFDFREKFLGMGFYNKNSLIAYRHLTDKKEIINKEFVRKRILNANKLRTKINPLRKSFRLVNSESDFLPGLIIDRFDDKYSVQTFSFGIDRFLSDISDILISEFNASLIIEKNDNDLRILEGLPKQEKIIYNQKGTEDVSFDTVIYDIKYHVDLLKGQKTGFYLDQVENHFELRKYIDGDSKVLDLFCNEGGFALNAASAGAKEITAVDSSQYAIEQASLNSGMNEFENISFVCCDVFKYLNSQDSVKHIFDLVILDPPSFTKSKKNVNSAIEGYIELNSKAMKLIKPGGILFTFSCSHHIDEKTFESIISKSALTAKRKIQVIGFKNCSYDHPVLPQMPETKYLKSYLLKIV
ncbi:MAG: class I SAM-dependent rRNA methyltransferase [Ignavibacteriae bacterium]|nr:class I SAM-dependent rRNA methyltransferase [Ignavibacteriota bacterium]